MPSPMEAQKRKIHSSPPDDSQRKKRRMDLHRAHGLQVNFPATSSLPPIPNGIVDTPLARLALKENRTDPEMPSLEELMRVQKKLTQRLEEFQMRTGRKVARGPEPPRNKTHWDYLLQEMEWMAKDFSEEHKWKRAQAKKLAQAIVKYHAQLVQRRRREGRAEVLRVRKLASKLAKEVRQFWIKVDRIKRTKIEAFEREKQKEKLDERLNEMVQNTQRITQDVAKQIKGIEASPSSSPTPGASPNAPTAPPTLEEQRANLLSMESAPSELSKSKYTIPSPTLLRFGDLRDYQRVGLDWLVSIHRKNVNGILADEMGLGKTIQTIALLAHLVESEHNWGPHLVVVPSSVIVNWECEFKRWCPALKILTYYGSPQVRKEKRTGWSKDNACHVCITSYNLVVKDFKAFQRVKWEYMILDEAHNIKNFQSQRWQTLLGFRTSHRLLLTGTPLQNNLIELWSLLHFLMPGVFESQTEFKEWFNDPLNGMVQRHENLNADHEILTRLHAILRPFVLRRLKRDVAKQIPPKFEHIVKCRLSLRQRRLYQDFMDRSSTQKALTNGNFLSMMNVLMQLRKVCNHPDLFAGRPIVSPFDMCRLVYEVPALVLNVNDTSSEVDLNVLNLSITRHEHLSTFAADSLHRLKHVPSSPTTGHIEPDFHPLFASFLKSQLQSRREQVRQRQNSFAWINDLRCSVSPIVGDNLVSLVSLRRGRDAFISPVSSRPLIHPLSPGSAPPTSFRDSRHLVSLLKSSESRVNQTRPLLNSFICRAPSARALAPRIVPSHNMPSLFRKEEERVSSLTQRFAAPLTPYFNLHLRSQMFFPDKRLIQWDCGKLQALDSLLRTLKQGGHRVLIFTQMTKMLDILENFLNIYQYRYLRLDGSTKVETRQKLMETFNTSDKYFVFILSTRSGGLGINLTGADTVIFYDSDWNPAMDAQAQDRCHRLGQTRDVHIYRMISDNTIEENIYKKAYQKKLINNAVIGDGNFTTDFFEKLDPRELLGLKEIKEGVVRAQPMEEEEEEKEEEEDVHITEADRQRIMRSVEDVEDNVGTKTLNQEAKDFAEEFSEGASGETTQSSAQLFSNEVESKLNTLQRYALRFLEGRAELAQRVPCSICNALSAPGTTLCANCHVKEQIKAAEENRHFSEVNKEPAERGWKPASLPPDVDAPQQEAEAGLRYLEDENKRARIPPSADLPNQQLFFLMEGDPAKLSSFALDALEAQGLVLAEPLDFGPFGRYIDLPDELPEEEYQLNEVQDEDWGLFATPEDLERMLPTIRRRSLVCVRSRPSSGILPRSLKVRIPRSRLKSYYQKKSSRQDVKLLPLRKNKRSLRDCRVRWTLDEDAALMKLVSMFGPNWQLASAMLQGDHTLGGRFRSQAECISRTWFLLSGSQNRRGASYVLDEQDVETIKKRFCKLSSNPQLMCRLELGIERDSCGIPLTFGAQPVFEQTTVAMKGVTDQRTACKHALRASLSQLDDKSPKAIVKAVHPSHEKALQEGRTNLGVPVSINIGKTLTPRQIIELRSRRHRQQYKQQSGHVSYFPPASVTGLGNLANPMLAQALAGGQSSVTDTMSTTSQGSMANPPSASVLPPASMPSIASQQSNPLSNPLGQSPQSQLLAQQLQRAQLLGMGLPTVGNMGMSGVGGLGGMNVNLGLNSPMAATTPTSTASTDSLPSASQSLNHMIRVLRSNPATQHKFAQIAQNPSLDKQQKTQYLLKLYEQAFQSRPDV